MPLFDEDELARMEQSLSGRAAARRGGRPGAGGVVLVLLAAVAIGAVVLLAVRGQQRVESAAAAATPPAGPSRAAEAARRALERAPLTEPATLETQAGELQERDAEAESQRRFEERRSQLATSRPTRSEAAATRRAGERQRAETWWRRHAAAIDALDAAAARVVNPETTRIDVACTDYVRTFEEILATDVRPAPTDELATAIQRYFFFHSNAVASCRAERFLDVQAQLATWSGAARSLEATVAEALSR